MKGFYIYLNFDGNTREAMSFYQKCLDAKLSLQTFRDAKMDVPKGAEDRIVHARLEKGEAILMASDTQPGMPFTPGDNFSISVQCESSAEIDRFFNALSEGGRITMPIQDTFWNARFGMLTDKFGVNWMFNYELPKKS